MSCMFDAQVKMLSSIDAEEIRASVIANPKETLLINRVGVMICQGLGLDRKQAGLLLVYAGCCALYTEKCYGPDNCNQN